MKLSEKAQQVLKVKLNIFVELKKLHFDEAVFEKLELLPNSPLFLCVTSLLQDLPVLPCLFQTLTHKIVCGV